MLNVFQNNCRKISVQQICQTNIWVETDHLKKIIYNVTESNLFSDVFQGFYFENPQQIFYGMVI